ncbi:MAG: retropepsin-like domain-containing protein [Euryarchaeota archaeon]|nr:retropepsin-like domain-containing protein [Euryarchaeota archaeon]
MGTIKEEIELVGTRKSKRIIALFDSGAHRNYIRKMLEDGDRAEDIGFHIFEGTHRAILANGDIAVGEKVRFKIIRIKECSFGEPEFIIMENLIADAIIGVNLMQRLGITLDPLNERIGL